jgi:hypothetical protein
MNDKYIYFEVLRITDKADLVERKMQNENIMLRKPHTNSIGVMGYTHITKKPGTDISICMDQYWVDLDVYVFGKQKLYDDLIMECLNKLKN